MLRRFPPRNPPPQEMNLFREIRPAQARYPDAVVVDYDDGAALEKALLHAMHTGGAVVVEGVHADSHMDPTLLALLVVFRTLRLRPTSAATVNPSAHIVSHSDMQTPTAALPPPPVRPYSAALFSTNH